MKKTLEQRFWEKVDKRDPNECWPWRGAKRGRSPCLYGTIRIEGELRGAHVVAFELQNGPLPELAEADTRGTCVRHSCDVGLCMNGRHLVAGTHQQNMTDKVERRRTTREKKFCKRGHPRTPENIYKTRQGPWQCRPCRRKEQRAF